jgi:hypothetical protein
MPKRSERPTVPPSFDVAQYAKDSDARLTRARAAAAAAEADAEQEDEAGQMPMPRSEMRLLTRPNAGPVVTDEAWARSMAGIPAVVMPPDQLKRLPLGHRAGFLLSRMDGATDIETLIELSAMPREETLRIVRDLFESGVVEFR